MSAKLAALLTDWQRGASSYDSQRIDEIPDVGLVTSAVDMATMGNDEAFDFSREFAGLFGPTESQPWRVIGVASIARSLGEFARSQFAKVIASLMQGIIVYNWTV